MRALVIGGTGFIGLNLVKALQEEGYHVLASRRPTSNTLFLRKFKPEMVELDCMDHPSLVSTLKRVDVVFMAAAYYPRYSVRCSEQVDYAVRMIRNVLQAAGEAGVQYFIYTGSVSTLRATSNGNAGKEEEDEIAPPPGSSVYYSVKYAMELEVLKAFEQGLQGNILSVAGCLGPFDVKMGTGSLLVHAVNEALPYYLDGKINLIDVEDVARLHVECLNKKPPRKRYVLAHHNTTVGSFLSYVSGRFSVKMPRKVPFWLGAPYVRLMEHHHFRRKSRPLIPLEFVDMLRYGRHYDCLRTKKEICDYDTPLETTVEKSYEWFKKYKYTRRTV